MLRVVAIPLQVSLEFFSVDRQAKAQEKVGGTGMAREGMAQNHLAGSRIFHLWG
jgi:hypothetical protein